jgi:hypothetical protein
MSAPISRRQQIVTAIATAFAGILTTGGFQTDIGAKVTQWDQTPITERRAKGVDVSDPEELSFPGTTLHQDHELTIYAVIHCKDEADDTPEYLRNAIADVWRTIGLDRTWGALARTTEPIKSEISLDQAGQITGGARVQFKVKYRTATFNPFS